MHWVFRFTTAPMDKQKSGSMERWRLNLYTIWFTQVVSLMSFNFGLPFLSYYIQDLGVTDSEEVKMFAGLLTSATAVSMGLMAPVWGRFADRFGKKLMLLRAICAGSVVMLLMGLAGNVYHLIVLRFIQGIFTGTITASAALVASTAPEKRLSYALGFMATSTQIGAVFGPALGGLVAEWFGYRASFFIASGLLLLDFFLVMFLVKDGSRPALTETDPVEKKAGGRSIFLTGWFILAMLFILFLRFSTNLFVPYLPIYVQSKLNTLEGASGTVGILSAFIGLMTALSGFILGRLGDKHDRIKLLKTYAISSFILSIPLFFINQLWLLAVQYGIMMFMAGGIDPVIMSISSSRIDKNRRGTLFGIQALVSCIAWATSPLIGGVVSIRHSVQAVLLVIPAFLLVETIMALFLGNRLIETPSITKEMINHDFST